MSRNVMRNEMKQQRGFSLIELMLAMALGLVVVTGIVQLFVGNSQTYTLLNGQARLQENARFAFDFIARSSRSAGYFGCAPETDNIVKLLRGNWTLMPEFDITLPVQGYEGAGDGSWTPSANTLPRTSGGVSANLYVAGNGIDIADIQAGTDIVAIRSIEQPTRRLAAVLQPDGNAIVDAPGGDPGFGTDDIVLVSDCEQAAVFRITNLVAGATTATLQRDTGVTGNFYENAPIIDSPTGPIPATLSFLGRSYGEEATVGRLQTSYFFIAPSSAQNNVGNTPLALWRKSGSAAPIELIQGVEDMQVLYGVDNSNADNVTNASQYQAFDAVADPTRIVAMRVTLTVNSVDAVTDQGDGLLRRSFTKTISVRNASPEA